MWGRPWHLGTLTERTVRVPARFTTACAPAVAAPQPPAAGKPRLYYIDWLRSFAIALVVCIHVVGLYFYGAGLAMFLVRRRAQPPVCLGLAPALGKPPLQLQRACGALAALNCSGAHAQSRESCG